MVIDAGQKWHHKHNRQLVDVLDASDGQVVFLRRESQIKWPVARFLVWYQQAKQQPKQDEPDTPKVGELWYSKAREESCLIKRVDDFVWYRNATETGDRRATESWFTHGHERVSKASMPQYHPATVAFPERFKKSLDNTVSAGQSIRTAAQTVKQARKVAEAAIAATGAVVAKADLIDDLKTRAIDVLAECHQVSQALRDALDRLETA